ncbi:SLC13 family permease [Wenzhouxiangella sp. XN201]|uniref:SLC13 family permease n=1 Tax=Wenzhouxiangella sp. XN201 TaxID=2710755 RepID=UPI0013CCEBE3|nr:SLC13 family permease [Wenzhouxiangella sp. XN201]NEZ05171.1 SLC13 family permease [Wenzhouxiangella sp. XN201]
MTVEIGLVFLIIGIALYLFASEKFPLDVTAFLILVSVTAIPLLFHSDWLLERGIDLQSAFPTVREGLSGLSSPATVTVLAMFILSAGVQRSGLIHRLGKLLAPWMSGPEWRQITIIALLVGPVSGLINNTAAVAVAIPLVLDMAKRSGSQASRLLLPLSFLAMMGGTLTLVGTSTNLLASSLLAESEAFGREIGMFEFTHLGLIVLATGLIYFLFIGRWLMPERDRIQVHDTDEESFIFEVQVRSGSNLVGKSIREAGFDERTGTEAVRLVRDEHSHIKRAATTRLKVNDILHLRGNRRQVADLIKSDDVEVLSNFGQARRVRSDGHLTRLLLRNDRVFENTPGREVDFWQRYQARVVGLEVESVDSQRLAEERLTVGEIVLVQVSSTAHDRLRRHPDVVVLDTFEDDFDTARMWSAGLVVAGVILAATLTPLPIVITALIGVVAMFFCGCLTREDLYSGVSWNVIFLLAGVIPLGIAMTKSGAAEWLATMLATNASGWHPLLVLMALYLITTVLTEMVSNNASVVILVPVAISVASQLAMPIFPVVLIVMFAASTSFLSPVGYQTNTMIYGTGLYRFTDFAKVGAPLNLILMVVTSTSIYWLWPV